MQKITFQDTTVLKKPYIDFNGIEYEVQDGSYDGGTDLNANTFNTMQNNIETAINENIILEQTNYLKFPDGTLICWGEIKVNGSVGTTTVNLPYNFKDNTYQVTITNEYNYGINLIWSSSDKQTSTFKTWVLTNTGVTPTDSSVAGYIAIGKWK